MANAPGLLLAAGLLTLSTIAYFNYKNKDKKKEKDANKTTEDISDNETRQALRLKALMDVNKNFGYWSADDIDDADEIRDLYNIMLEITDWAKVQQKFNTLCNNEFSLIKALQEATADNYNVYTTALQLAAAKKCVTTAAVKFNVKAETIDARNTVEIPANAVVGALAATYTTYYKFINSYTITGVYGFRQVVPLYGEISTKYIKLV